MADKVICSCSNLDHIHPLLRISDTKDNKHSHNFTKQDIFKNIYSYQTTTNRIFAKPFKKLLDI